MENPMCAYMCMYPLIASQNYGKSPFFNGKIHYFDWAMFNSFLYVYQRVYVFVCENHFPASHVGLPGYYFLGYDMICFSIKTATANFVGSEKTQERQNSCSENV